MKYLFSIIVFFQTIFPVHVFSQIGINTNSPATLFHIDAARNTVNNTNTADDVVVTYEGKIGIGTISPHKNLTVNGEFRVGIDKAGMGEGNRLYLRGNDENSDPVWISRYNAGTDKTHIRFNIGDDAYDESGKKDRMVIGTTLPGTEIFKSLYVIQSDGKIGVNVDNPLYTLDIKGDIHAEEGLIIPIKKKYISIFGEKYKLKSLSKQNKQEYLINMTDCFNEDGDIILNQLSIYYLKRIEELVLYKIQLDNMLKNLNRELEEQDRNLLNLAIN